MSLSGRFFEISGLINDNLRGVFVMFQGDKNRRLGNWMGRNAFSLRGRKGCW